MNMGTSEIIHKKFEQKIDGREYSNNTSGTEY